jgi:hypothetical protein
MVNFLGALIFATIVGIGWFDSKGSLSPFGKYFSSNVTRRRPPTPSADRRGDEDQPKPPAPAL